MKLLTPLQIGPLTVKNRVVSTAHGAFFDFYSPQSDGERYIGYQARRAEGGTGLIICTAMHVHRSSQRHGQFLYERGDLVTKYRRLVAEVHPHGCKLLQQIYHYGAVGRSEGRDDLQPLWSLSGTPSSEGEASHEMTAEEIEEVIQGFVDAATTAIEGGLDGVEIHATHGYLLIQSLSPWANRRSDEWGDPFRLITTVARRVRAAIGPDRVMGLRLTADDFRTPEAGGLGHARLCEIAAHLVSLNLFDYLNHSEGSGGADYARAVSTYRHRLGEFLPLTRGLREAIDRRIPVIGVGKIPTPDLAEHALANGFCDLVGMTRAQISDPDLVRKLMAGQAERIRICTGSNQGCQDRMWGPFPITCFHNPEVGMERKLKLEPAPARDPVLVIGGGPAGMKAAEIAARRGYAVTLVEQDSRLGGRLNLVEHLGDAANLLASTAWVEQELQHHQVDVQLQTRVDAAFLANHVAKHVVLAAGAVPASELPAPTDGSIPVLTSDAAARGMFEGVRIDMRGTRALVVDLRGNLEIALVIETLIRRGCQVTVLTPFLNYGPSVGVTHLVELMKYFLQHDCDLRTTATLTAIAGGRASFSNALSGKQGSDSFDFVVAGVHPRPDKVLYEMLRRKWPRVLMAGDVVAPRTAMESFREGDRAGRSLQ